MRPSIMIGFERLMVGENEWRPNNLEIPWQQGQLRMVYFRLCSKIVIPAEDRWRNPAEGFVDTCQNRR